MEYIKVELNKETLPKKSDLITLNFRVSGPEFQEEIRLEGILNPETLWFSTKITEQDLLTWKKASESNKEFIEVEVDKTTLPLYGRKVECKYFDIIDEVIKVGQGEFGELEPLFYLKESNKTVYCSDLIEWKYIE